MVTGKSTSQLMLQFWRRLGRDGGDFWADISNDLLLNLNSYHSGNEHP